MKEFERVVLTRDLPGHRLRAGDVGTIVHVSDGGLAFEIEFFTAGGETIGVFTVEAEDVRPPDPDEVLHVRRSQPAV